jgi:hypothetical protein
MSVISCSTLYIFIWLKIIKYCKHVVNCFVIQISTGRTHSAAWTSPSLPRRSQGVSIPLRFGLPAHIPPQYGHLQGVSIVAIQARLKLLYRFSDTLYACWRLLPLCPQVWTELRLTSFDVDFIVKKDLVCIVSSLFYITFYTKLSNVIVSAGLRPFRAPGHSHFGAPPHTL